MNESTQTDKVATKTAGKIAPSGTEFNASAENSCSVDPLAVASEKLLAAPISALGYQLLAVSFINTRTRILRVLIDSPNGIGLHDCSKVSELVSRLLDVEGLVTGGQYQLEVTSPGLFRRLREERHFLQSVGKRVKVFIASEWLSQADQPSLPVQIGVIKAVKEGMLHLEVAKQILILPLSQIDTAQLAPILNFNNSKLNSVIESRT